jgi:hypothetical protein
MLSIKELGLNTVVSLFSGCLSLLVQVEILLEGNKFRFVASP